MEKVRGLTRTHHSANCFRSNCIPASLSGMTMNQQCSRVNEWKDLNAREVLSPTALIYKSRRGKEAHLRPWLMALWWVDGDKTPSLLSADPPCGGRSLGRWDIKISWWLLNQQMVVRSGIRAALNQMIRQKKPRTRRVHHSAKWILYWLSCSVYDPGLSRVRRYEIDLEWMMTDMSQLHLYHHLVQGDVWRNTLCGACHG